MKKDTHPTYYPNATITCSCGNSFTVGATKEKINVEICSACHPFFTGTEKIVDTAGRVEKFKTRRAQAAPEKKVAQKAKVEKRKIERVKNATTKGVKAKK